MKTIISSPNMRLDGTHRRIAEKRIRVALGRLSHRIRQISLTLTDEKHPMEPATKHCRAIVSVRGFDSVTTEGRHENIVAAIDMAIRRLRRVLLKQLNRRIARFRRNAEPIVFNEAPEMTIADIRNAC
ncbi:MAG: HPF/RaiA family ribosome-associated protein [bacterium]|nr:HPF/RaiA family ribosome-associated protein [bacterium]